MEPPNTTDYLRRHTVDATTAMWLGHALLAALPADPTPAVSEAADALGAAHGAVVAAHKRQQAQQSDDLRPVHRSVCALWGAMVGRIEHCRALPPERFVHGVAVERLLALLAPDGNAALALAYPNVWTTLHTRLSLVVDAGLRGAMIELAGAPFVTATEASLDAFGRALGITAAPVAASEDNLRELLREFMQAVSDYALQVLATVRRNRPETALAAQATLRPLDELRGMVRRRNASADAEEGDADAAAKEKADAKDKTDAKEKTDAKAKAPEKTDAPTKDKVAEKTDAPVAAPTPSPVAAPVAAPRSSAIPPARPSVAPPN